MYFDADVNTPLLSLPDQASSTQPDTPIPSLPDQEPSTQPDTPIPSLPDQEPSTQPDTHIPSLPDQASSTQPDTPIPSLPDQTSSTQPDTTLSSPPHYSSCKKLLEAGHGVSGTCIYTIFPDGFNKSLQVYCDMDTDGGGWIVIQRRQDGSVDFYRNWNGYRAGFGNLSGEFWLGNDNLRTLTKPEGTWQLHIDWDKKMAWAEYGFFQITGDNFTLHINSYKTDNTAGESLICHDSMMFTTYDNNNDQYGGNL